LQPYNQRLRLCISLSALLLSSCSAQVVLAAIKLMSEEPDFLQQCGPELQPRLRRYIQQHPSLRKQLQQQQQQQGVTASDTVEQPRRCTQDQQQQQGEAMQDKDTAVVKQQQQQQQQQQQCQLAVHASCPSVDQRGGQKQQKTLQSALEAAVDLQQQQQREGDVDDDDAMQIDDVHPFQDQQQQQQQQGPKRALSLPKLDPQEAQEGSSR
jgi:hypothetical protein